MWYKTVLRLASARALRGRGAWGSRNQADACYQRHSSGLRSEKPMAGVRALLTSDHVNYMVFRYLQEAGFTHSAFTFAHESSVIQAPLDPNSVAPGSLIALLQKGLQFLELESNLDGQDGDVDGDFKMLTPEELLTNDIDTLKQLVQERREEERTGGRSQADRRKEKPARDKDRDQEKAKAQAAASSKPAEAPKPAPAPAPEAQAPVPMEEEPSPSQLELPASSVVRLQGHSSEVYVCSWNQAEPLLASGSGDGTARIWNLAPGSNYCKSTSLVHDMRTEHQRDVTTVDWSPDGTMLATGACDGLARVWTRDGKLKHTLDFKQGTLFALKWNRKGDLLVTGSVDAHTVVWDMKTAEVKQTHQLHTAATLDVDWRNNTSFATCSSDRLIYVLKIGDKEPLRKWVGHTDEVNCIRWDPSGQFLASGADDHSARIWSFKSDDCVHHLAQHTNSIYTLKWSPTGPGSSHPSQPAQLATASFDSTVKLWEIDGGKCTTTLQGHSQPVYSLSFSPNGKYLATGSMDKSILIWNVADGSLVKTCHSDAGIYEVCWNAAGDKLAACFSNKVVKVLDMRM